MVLPTGGRKPGIPGQSRNELTDRILGLGSTIDTLVRHRGGHYAAKAFGFAPDKTPSENTAAVHAALSAAGPGGTVYLDPGMYQVNEITMSTSGQTLVLDDHCTLRRPDGTTQRIIYIPAGRSRITIRGGILDGNEAGSSGEIVFTSSDVHDVTIENVQFHGGSIRSKGVSGPVNSRITIRGCRFFGTGINFNWETVESMIVDNYFDMGGVDRNAVWIGNGSRNCNISGNVIKGVSRIGIEVWDRDSAHCVVTDNILYLENDTPSMGISMEGDYGIVANNQIICKEPATKGVNGIELVVGIGQKAIGNTMLGSAVSVDSVRDTIIVGNRISGAYSFAMQLVDGGSTGVVGSPSHILIRDNVFANNQNRAIMIQNDVSMISIIGNHFINNAGHDIFLNNNVDYFLVANNIFDIGSKTSDMMWGGGKSTGIVSGNIVFGDKGLNVQPDLPVRDLIRYSSAGVKSTLSGGTGGLIRASFNPPEQLYSSGRNYLNSTGAIGSSNSRFMHRGGAQVLPQEWTLPPKVGNIEPGIVFVFNTGAEVERRNSTASPVTETWESTRKDIYGTSDRGGILWVHLIAHNTAGSDETQDLGQYNLFGVAV